MTSRERVSLALQHKEADRIAIHDGPWGSTVTRWRREGLPEDQSPASYFGYEFRGFGANESLQLPTKVIEDTDEYVIATTQDGSFATGREKQAHQNSLILRSLTVRSGRSIGHEWQ